MKKTVNEKKTTGKAEKTGAAKKSVEKVVPLPVTEAEAPATEGAVVPRQEAAAPVRTVETVTLEIVTLKQQARQVLTGYAIEIGRRLVEVKEMLPHGEWGAYLRERVEYSQSTAESFMRLFREYGEEQQSLFGAEAKSQTLAILPYSKALALLALPADEREEFAEEHDVEGMSTRELQAALRAKEEAEANAKSAEEARAKMEEDMRLANVRMSDAKEEVEDARRAQEEAEAKAEELARKLEELEKRPIDVAVEAADPAELEKARQEGRKAAETELLDKVAEAERTKETAVEKVREELKAAKAAQQEAREAERRREEELRKAQAEAERLKKALEASSTKEIAAFQVYFEAVQKDFASALDSLNKIVKAGDKEHHDKLVDALGALLEALNRQVPDKIGGGAA